MSWEKRRRRRRRRREDEGRGERGGEVVGWGGVYRDGLLERPQARRG